MEYSRTRKTLYNAFFGVVTRVITLVMSFVTRTIFIKTLGIQYAGVSSVFTDVLTVLSFAELGIGSAITYALYKPIAENDEEQIAKYMTVYKKIYRVIALVVFAVGLLLIPFLDYIITDAPDIQEDIRLIYFLYLLNASVSYLLVYKSTFLTAAQKDYLVSRYKIIISIVRLVVEIIILLLTHNFILYLIVAIAMTIVNNFIIAKVAEREYPVIKKKSDVHLEKHEKKKLIGDVRALALYKVSGTLVNSTDSIITSSMLGTTTAGILGNYTLISNQLYNFLMQIFIASAASIGNLAVSSKAGAQYEVFKKMNLICYWIYFVCGTCLWTLFNPFMKLWQGEELLFGTVTVIVLVLDFYIKGMLSPITQFRTANGLFVQGKYRPVIMAIINLVVSVVLAKQIGITGIILGTIISRATTQLWYDPWLVFKNVFSKNVLKFYAEYIMQVVLLITACALSSWILSVVCPVTSILSLIVGGIASVVISNVLFVIVYGRTDAFKAVLALLKKIIKKEL